MGRVSPMMRLGTLTVLLALVLLVAIPADTQAGPNYRQLERLAEEYLQPWVRKLIPKRPPRPSTLNKLYKYFSPPADVVIEPCGCYLWPPSIPTIPPECEGRETVLPQYCGDWCQTMHRFAARPFFAPTYRWVCR